MFVLLEHKTTSGPGDVHWDLIVQVPGEDLLPTWRLADNPLASDRPIAAERIADHRPAYLAYEGEVSGERGSVRRIDWGEADVVRFGETGLYVRLSGQRLKGHFELAPGVSGGLRFARTP